MRIVFFKHLKPARLTNLITQLSKLAEEKFIIVEFSSAFEVVSAYDQMVVNMLPVYMRSNQDLTVSKATGKLHTDLVRFLRGDILTDLEGLHVVVKANAVGLVPEHFLRGEEGLVCHLGNTVVARYVCELLVLVKRFGRLHTVIDHALLRTWCLLFLGDAFNDCHCCFLRG